MAFPTAFKGRLTLPAIAAPMFLVSGPDLVIAACRAGVLGTFPALNQRTSDGFSAWLDQIGGALTAADAPYGVNLIVHKSNPRLRADLDIAVRRKVPLIITSLGVVAELVEAVHSYGGLVFHDVVNVRHAEKALEAGVDGIIAVSGGAGGHAGTYNPLAFIAELRPLLGDRTLILSGAITQGGQIAAAIAAGADLAYLGTRFVATQESMAQPEYKQMVIASSAKDIIYTPKVSGVPASFLAASIARAGLDLEGGQPGEIDFGSEHEAKAWRDVWSAGHGVGAITDAPPAAELIARLRAEYNAAIARLGAFEGVLRK